MTKLRVFEPTGKKCSWHDCNRSAMKYSGRHKIKGKTIHCVNHTQMKISGRVSHNHYDRDHYRQHLKPSCAMFKDTTFKSKYKEIKKFSEENGHNLDKRTICKYAFGCFEVDHINGDHNDNQPRNLQTLSRDAHKLKSYLNDDFNMYR